MTLRASSDTEYCMAKIEFTHQFDLQEAMDRVRALTDYWGTNYGIKSDWTDTGVAMSGKVRGASFTGKVHFVDHLVKGEIKAGFIAERLGGRAYVERKLRDYLNAANSLDSLRARTP